MSGESKYLILASGSATRQTILKQAGLQQAGVQIVAVPSHIDEDSVKASFRHEGHTAAILAEALAEAKASQVSLRPGHETTLVLGADQVLECGGEWFSKPTSRAEARATLKALSGRVHALHVSAVVCRDGVRLWGHTEKAELTMRRLSEDFIETYLDQVGARAFESVGAYQLEGEGAQLFSQIQGDFFTILGLPLLAVLGYLREHGLLMS